MQNSSLSASVFAWSIKEIAKMFGIFCPFTADLIWKEGGFNDCVESVHLDKLDLLGIEIDEELLNQMETIRDLSTQALKVRQEKAVKVRQPLNALKIKKEMNILDGILDILKDEINVKNVLFDPSINDEMELDLNLTPELINEGKYRELIRLIQDLRQELGYSPNDLVDLSITNISEDDF